MSDKRAVGGERTVAYVGDRPSRTLRLQQRLWIALLMLGVGGVLTAYYVNLHDRSRAGSAGSARQPATGSEMKLPPFPEITLVRDAQARAMAAPASGAMSTDGLSPAPASAATGGPTVDLTAAPADPRAIGTPVPSGVASPVAIRSDGGQTAVPRTLATTNAEAMSADVAVPALPRAHRLDGLRWVLPKGAALDCTLETAIDSTIPGMTTCVLAEDVYGADGRLVLLERGTRLIGETRGELHAGQSRVVVVWNEARTPTGVEVPLQSPGTDPLGRAGVPGAIDRHSGERFGAAVLLSLIDGALAAVTGHQQGSTAIVYATPGSRDVATEVLRNTVNIPPTLRVAPGARVQVLVARDIDFHDVYRLVPHEPS
jgi:type IV secretion system protein VirB10